LRGPGGDPEPSGRTRGGSGRLRLGWLTARHSSRKDARDAHINEKRPFVRLRGQDLQGADELLAAGQRLRIQQVLECDADDQIVHGGAETLSRLRVELVR